MEKLRTADTAHVAGLMVLGALVVLAALRGSFGGIVVRLGD